MLQTQCNPPSSPSNSRDLQILAQGLVLLHLHPSTLVKKYFLEVLEHFQNKCLNRGCLTLS